MKSEIRLTTVPEKINGTKQRNEAKKWKDKKLWYLFLCNFYLPWAKSYFWRGDLVLGSACNKLWDFVDISWSSKILRLWSSSYLWGNSYRKFIILEIPHYLWRIKFTLKCSEAALQRCSYKKVFWKYAANLKENTDAKRQLQ